MEKASESIEEHKIDWHDSLSIVLMWKHGIGEIYFNDRHFDGVEGISRVFE